MDFKTELAKLSEHLVKKAIQHDTPFAESIDAFKELRAYYALIAKETKPDEGDGTPSFAGFQRQVHQAEQGNGRAVRTRREHS